MITSAQSEDWDHGDGKQADGIGRKRRRWESTCVTPYTPEAFSIRIPTTMEKGESRPAERSRGRR